VHLIYSTCEHCSRRQERRNVDPDEKNHPLNLDRANQGFAAFAYATARNLHFDLTNTRLGFLANRLASVNRAYYLPPVHPSFPWVKIEVIRTIGSIRRVRAISFDIVSRD